MMGKKRAFFIHLLLLCLLLSACGSTPTETPSEPPVQESSLPLESSSEEPSEEPIEEEDTITLPENWYAFSPTPEDIITFRFVDFKDDPVPGLYTDLYPRTIVEPGEKRVQTGPVPVLTGQTDQNGEIIWRDYFPCREGEEYVLQVTSAAIGDRNYTNTTSYVLSDLKGLDGGYIAKYLWEEGYHSTDEAKLLDADFISDSELLLHYSFNPGGNIFEIYNIDTLKTTAVPLTEYMDDPGFHGMTNGKDVIYAYTETSYAIIDKATKTITQFGDFPEPYLFTDQAISVDGNYIYRNEKEIGISPISDLTQKEVLKVSDENYFFHAPHYSPDGKKVLLWEGEAPGHGVHCVDLITGEEAIIPFFSDWDPAQEWFFSDLLWSYNSDEIYFSMMSFPDEDKTILVRFNAATGEKIAQYEPPCIEGKKCHIRLLDVYQDMLLFEATYYHDGPESSHTLYLLDLNTEEFVPLAAAEDNHYFMEAHFSPDGSKVVALNPSNISKQMQIITLNDVLNRCIPKNPMFMIEGIMFEIFKLPDITADQPPYEDSPYAKYKDKFIGVIEKENRYLKPDGNLESIKIDVGTKIYTMDMEGAGNDPDYAFVFRGPILLVETQGGALYRAELRIEDESMRNEIEILAHEKFYS